MRKCSLRASDHACRLVTRLLLVASLLATPSATAQVLDLPVGPPSLGEDTEARAVIERLGREIQLLARRERGATEVTRTFLRASINVRITAAELLTQAEASGRAGSVAALFGFGLDDGRAVLDAALEALEAMTPEPRDGHVDPALEAIRRFNDAAVELASGLRATDAASLDATMHGIFTPLAVALEPVFSDPPTSHWPTLTTDAAPATEPMIAPPTVDAITAELDALATRCVTPPLRADTRDVLLETTVFLRRGARFPALAAQVDAARRSLEIAIDFGETLAAADWLSDARRAVYEDRLHASVGRFRTPATRAEGVAAIETLELSGMLIARITRLRELHVRPRPLATALARLDGLDPPPDAGPDGAGADRPPRGARADAVELRRVAAVLDAMITLRTASDDELPRGLRTTWAKLRRGYDDAEAALLAALENATGTTLPRSDPAFLSLLAAHRRALADLDRVRDAPRLTEGLIAIEPRSANAFRVQLRRLCALLLDPQRRVASARDLDRLQTQLAAFLPVPFERALADGDPAAIIATGGRQDELRAAIDEVRLAWARAWSRGETDGPAAQRMEDLARLAGLMEVSAEVLDLRDQPLLLDRWAAWWIPAWLVRRQTRDLPNRLKLATAALLDGEPERFARETTRIEDAAPLALLVGALTVELDEALVDLPDGAAGLLGRLVHPPTPEAWLLDQRAELAELCRYAIEAEHARARGGDDEALARFVNSLTAGVRRRLAADA